MWNKLPIKDKLDLMRVYKKNNYSYFDMIDDYNTKFREGGKYLTVEDEYHHVYRNADGDIMVNHPKEDKGKWDTINLTEKSDASTISEGVNAVKEWHRNNPSYNYGGLVEYAKGGLIKRADGSYSKRGLWDNIRANRGSGKEPTPEMLEQERKIKAKYPDGGRTPIYVTDKNSKEYETLYRANKIASEYDQKGMPTAYIAPDLPEVTITAERPRSFWDKVTERIAESSGGKDWYKDPSQGFGKALSDVVMLPFSTPQLASVYGLTGKVQTPSEAMDIQNPYGAFAVDAILDPANLVGAELTKIPQAIRAGLKSGVKTTGKYLTTQTPLKNAYKINPWAFKPKEGLFYRQVGEPGYLNAISEGKVLAKGQKEFLEANPNFNYWDEYNRFQEYTKRSGLNLEKPKIAPFFQRDELFFPLSNKQGFGRGKTAKSDIKYLFEGKLPEEGILPRYRDHYLSRDVFERAGTGVLNPEYNDLSNFNIYKKDWLRGYKPVEVPKQSFKSEIDWAKWNKEIPENKALIKEYNAIEQQAKANGTWMKNPDGSPTRLPDGKLATPEQWVQAQSKQWEKAYGSKGFDNVGEMSRGYYNDITQDAAKHYPKGRSIFGGDDLTGMHYAPEKQIVTANTGQKGVFNLIYPKNPKGLNIDAKGSPWTEIVVDPKLGIENRWNGAKGTYRKNYLDQQLVRTDDIAYHLEQNDLPYAKIDNLFDGVPAKHTTIVNNKPGNYLKSLWGNNGMFDMTNPNIYKALIPTIGVSAALQRSKLPQKIKE